MDNLNKTIDSFYELQLKIKEHDKKELKSSSWKSFVIAFRESLTPNKPQTQFKPQQQQQQLPSKNAIQIHHKKESPKKVEASSPNNTTVKHSITDKVHDIINKPKQQKPIVPPSSSSIKKELPNKSPPKPLNEYNPDRTPDAIDSCGSFGNDGDVSPELKSCDKLSPIHNNNNNSNNMSKVNKDNLYLVNNNNKSKNGIEVNKTKITIPLSIFGNSNIKYIEDLDQYIKERSRENSQNSKHYNKQHINNNNTKQTITSPNHNNNNTSSILNKNNSNLIPSKRSLPLHHHVNPIKQSKPLPNSTNNISSSSSSNTLHQPKKDLLKTYLDIFDKSISKLKNEYNDKSHHIQNATRLSQIASTFKDISFLQSKNKSLLETPSSADKHKDQSIIYNTLSILKLVCTVFECEDKCELLFNKNKEIFSSLIDVLKYMKLKYKESNLNKPLWLNQSKLIVKFIMSLILLKSYTHVKLKELIHKNISNDSKMKNIIEFITVYDNYSKTVVAIRDYYTNTIEELKDNNKNKKKLIESVVEYLKKEPNAMKYRTCFNLAKKIIEITLDSNTTNTNNIN